MLHEILARLTIPGLPDWTGLVLALILLVLGLCVLLMPFSVFGVKARLDAIEAQLDELRAEIRGLSVRLSEGRPVRDWSPGSDIDLPTPSRDDTTTPRQHPDMPTRGRSEPRITWPRGR